MPDPILILEAMGAAAATAAAVLLLCAWPWRKPGLVRSAVGSVLGIAAGFYVGCWMLGFRPHWPPSEDQDRLLLILFPAVLGLELLAAFPGRLRWLIGLARLGVAAGAAPILLHNSIYLTDAAGPGTQEWSPAQAWMIPAGLALAMASVWAALLVLDRRTPGRSLPLAVSLACAGAAVTVMLSGYASGGQLGLPLAAGLAAVVI